MGESVIVEGAKVGITCTYRLGGRLFETQAKKVTLQLGMISCWTVN